MRSELTMTSYRKLSRRLVVKKRIHLGKPLKGPLRGKYRLTVRRDYRVVYRIEEEQQLVVVEKIGHRSKVYK